MKSLDSLSDLTPRPAPWVKLGHEIDNFVFLFLISPLLLSFRALECIRDIGKPYVKSLDSQSDYPLPPLLWVKLGCIK